MIFHRTASLQSLALDSVVGVTLGNFDGMHLGHQALLERLGDELSEFEPERGQIRVMASFYPHPRKVLAGVKEPEQLTPMREKALLAESLGVDIYYAMHFTKDFAKLSAEDFVEQYLVQRLRADVVVVGHDWSFGAGRSGTTETLTELAHKFGFRASVVNPVMQDGERISSSRVRDALRAGNLDQVRALLGRNHCISGKVVHGDKRGGKIGFPTANQSLRAAFIPRHGVYATRVAMDGKDYPAVSNLGTRPTVDGTSVHLETHIFADFTDKLYGKPIRTELCGFLRDEKRFTSVDELREQIARDCRSAKEFHAILQ